jgi:hypothetical protein
MGCRNALITGQQLHSQFLRSEGCRSAAHLHCSHRQTPCQRHSCLPLPRPLLPLRRRQRCCLGAALLLLLVLRRWPLQ